jgi:hypothetical protein
VHLPPCLLSSHPDWNRSSKPWLESNSHKKFLANKEVVSAALGKEYYNRLPPTVDSDGNKGDWGGPARNPRPKNQDKSSKGTGKDKKDKKGEQLNFIGGSEVPVSAGSEVEHPILPSPDTETRETWNHIFNEFDRDSFVTASISLNNSNIPIQVKALLDTGALHSNYVSVGLASELQKVGYPLRPCTSKVSSAVADGRSVECLGEVDINLNYFDELSKKHELLPLTLKIIPLNIPIIIGLPTIRSAELIKRMESFFLLPLRSGIVLENTNTEGTFSSKERLALRASVGTTPDGKGLQYVTTAGVPANKAVEVLAAIANHLENDSYLFEEDDSEVQWEVHHDKEADVVSSSDDELLPHIEGTDSLKGRLKAICLKYKGIFSFKLKTSPADVKPLELEVDKKMWESKSNALPPRRLPVSTQKELSEQIDSLEKAEVIRPSQAPYYSQILMVPKKDKTWRFCIDFRQLNAATKSMSWTIPHIKEVLDRIGSQSPQYFGVLDFLKGYYQAPLHENSRQYSAFKCFKGTYEWLRVPMGLKGAPSYFQQQMAHKVIGSNLLYHGVELYIDDVLIHAATEEEYLERIEKLFERLLSHNITVNPKKCFLGLSKIEYVGHVIDKDGVSFSPEKINKVLNFARPTSMTSLRSFLGFVNYFRTHIKNLSVMEQPMLEILHKGVAGRAKFHWPPKAQKAFEEVQDACRELPKLFFAHPDAATVVFTDASDYGYGSYTVQRRIGPDGQITEVPIAFLSGIFNKQQRNWPTIEKECFAIVHTLKKLDYLLRDRPFTIKTDHRNLLYLNNSNISSKVLRWKMFLQEFDFNIEHIAGKDNIVADGLSRIMVQEENHDLLNLIGGEEGEEVPPNEISDQIDVRGNIREKTLEEKYHLFNLAHNSLTGHHGIAGTIRKFLKIEPLPWKRYRTDIEKFVKECPTCQKTNVIQPDITSVKFVNHTYEPFERINVDTIGPISSADSVGNKYILTVRDTFSRFTLLYPMQNADAPCVARSLLMLIGTFGCPREMLSDGGPEFINGVITELCRIIGIDHMKTIAYSKEENGIVERGNKEVQRFLRDIIFDKRVLKEWSLYVPLIQRIINSTKNQATGFTPAEIIFGNGIDLDRGFLTPFNFSETDGNVSEFVKGLTSYQEKVIAASKKKLLQHEQEHVNNQSKNITIFPDNSQVLMSYPYVDGKSKPPTKQSVNWKGPYQVIRHDKNTYTLLDHITKKEFQVNVQYLKKYIVRENSNLIDIASRDRDEYIVDKIIDIRGNPVINNLSKIEFLVKWAGYEDSDNSWEPFTNLRNNDRLHEFLRGKELVHLIPKEHRRLDDIVKSRRKRKLQFVDEVELIT